MIRLLIATLLLFGFHTKPGLPTIEIYSVDMNIHTRSRVDCSKFHQSFEKRKIKRKIVYKEDEIRDLISELETLEVYSGRNATDTRAVLLINYPDHAETICADKFSIYKDQTCYKITEKLKKIIW